MSEDKDVGKSKGQWHGGKGSVQKPNDQDKYAENWDLIWGKKKEVIDEFSERARPDGLLWEKNKVENTKTIRLSICVEIDATDDEEYNVLMNDGKALNNRIKEIIADSKYLPGKLEGGINLSNNKLPIIKEKK
jgi:hypothetical protein